MPRSLALVACAAALIGASGCGESEQEQAREAVQAYVDATNEGDFQGVCDTYSASFKEELGVDDEACAAFVQEQTTGADQPQTLELVQVSVNDDTATADIDATREDGGPSRITLTLERDGDDWYITALQ